MNLMINKYPYFPKNGSTLSFTLCKDAWTKSGKIDKKKILLDTML